MKTLFDYKGVNLFWHKRQRNLFILISVFGMSKFRWFRFGKDRALWFMKTDPGKYLTFKGIPSIIVLIIGIVAFTAPDAAASGNPKKEAARRLEARIDVVEDAMLKVIDDEKKLYRLCRVKNERVEEAVAFMKRNYHIFKGGRRAADQYRVARYEDCEIYNGSAEDSETDSTRLDP